MNKFLVVALVLLASACSTAPQTGPVTVETTPSPEVESRPETPIKTVPPQRAPISGAASSLLRKAELAAGRGDFEQALALLERAQRIDPDSGEVYLAQAQTYSRKGDGAMASAAAQRGMLYCNGPEQCNALRAYARQ